MKNILGIDPATATGFCFTDGTRFEHGTWDISRNRWPDRSGGRLHELRNRILEVHGLWGPIELIAFEEASFGGNQVKMQMQVILFHARLRGIIEEVACDIGAQTLLVNPLTLKAWATDNGHATKDQMMRALSRHYGITASDHNDSDAVWCLKYGEHWLKHPELQREKVLKKSKSKTRRPRSSTPQKKMF